MSLLGRNLIGQQSLSGSNGQLWAVEAESGSRLEPAFGGASLDDLDQACQLAHCAFNTYRDSAPEVRARFLELIATNILELGDELVTRCCAETGLPRARVEGERGRTIGQLRMFASVVRGGAYLDARIDPAQPERKPLARLDLRLRNIAIGPVAVFGASNFPLAFSVAGGDTASALAAGCPVIVKAHSAHPGTSELVGRAIQSAVKACGLPEGTFSLLFDAKREIGPALVADHRIKAVGFTGSRVAGTQLMHIAAARPEPVPVYAEMSSINPVVLLPQALVDRAEPIAHAFVTSLTMGAGQFCTSPGLVLALESDDLQAFIRSASSAISDCPAQTMLTPNILRSFCDGVAALKAHPAVEVVGEGQAGENKGQAVLFSVNASEFLLHDELRGEVFGSASVIVKCQDKAQLIEVLGSLEGQLTAALHMAEGDTEFARELVPTLEVKAGRILINGFGTGVEVGHAMVHGGPFPSTSDSRSTSVGSLAIHRFLRPVSYQAFPAALLPAALLDDNPLHVPQRIDGELSAV